MNNAAGTIKVDSEELAVEFVEGVRDGYVHRHTITVRHPEGGKAVFAVDDYRGFMAFEQTAEAPINVHAAVLALVKRMDRDWAGSIAGERFDVVAAFQRALVAS